MSRSDICDYSDAFIVVKGEWVVCVLMMLTDKIKS